MIKQKFNELSELIANIKRVVRLAYEIDKKIVVAYYLSAAVGGLAPIIAAWLFKIFIDRLTLPNNEIFAVGSIPLGLIAILVAYYFVRLSEIILYWGLNVGYFDYLLRNKMQMGLTYRYAKKLSSLDVEHLEDCDTQNLITKVQHTFQWQIPDFLRVWGYVFANILNIGFSIAVLLPFGYWIPILILLVSTPRIYFKIKHGNFVWAMYGGGAPESKKLWYLNGLLTDTESILETKIFQSQAALLEKFDKVQNHLFDVNKKPLDNYRWVLIGAPIAETVVVFGIICYLIPQYSAQTMSVGALAFVVTALESLRNNMAWGANHLGELYEKNLFIKPYFELMSLKKIIREKKNAHVFKKIEPPLIEFKNVSFVYPNGREVLKNVSFMVKPGENIALVGVNGAGKTTIIKLLCRFYDASSGEILINGVNIKDLQLANWYKHLGTCFQNFVRYNFSVKENIMLGLPGVYDIKRMKEAAVQSGAWDFIQKFEHQYEQMLGRQFEDGEELSGGQWQKLAIARVFYERAPVLIMDEPTSAIDAQAEYEIFNNLEKIYSDKTLILVSHRFSTVRNAGNIIVLDNGEIIERGSHQELLAQNGKYASMFTTQAKGYK